MNTTFTLKNLEINVEDTPIKIGELTTTVSDYNLLEGLQVAKEIPAVIREIKDVFIEAIKEERDYDDNIHQLVQLEREVEHLRDNAEKLEKKAKDVEFEEAMARSDIDEGELKNHLLFNYSVLSYYDLKTSEKVKVLAWLAGEEETASVE